MGGDEVAFFSEVLGMVGGVPGEEGAGGGGEAGGAIVVKVGVAVAVRGVEDLEEDGGWVASVGGLWGGWIMLGGICGWS